MRGREEVTQREMHELSEGRGGRKRDAGKPPFPVKDEYPANMIEITKHALDPVLPQSAGRLGTTPTEPTP